MLFKLMMIITLGPNVSTCMSTCADLRQVFQSCVWAMYILTANTAQIANFSCQVGGCWLYLVTFLQRSQKLCLGCVLHVKNSLDAVKLHMDRNIE